MLPAWTPNEEDDYRAAMREAHETKDDFERGDSNPIRAGLIIAFVLLLLTIICTKSLRAEEPHEGGVGVAGKLKAVASPPLAAGPSQPRPYDQIAAGMQPLEVAGVLGLESLVEINGRVLTVTWWHDGTWITVVFVDMACISKSKGRTGVPASAADH